MHFSIGSCNHPCCTDQQNLFILTRNLSPLTNRISPFPPLPSPWQLSLYTLFLCLKLSYFSVNYMFPFVWPYFLVQFVDFKKCTRWELQVQLYLGQNEDCSLGDSRSDSLETARERQWGRSVYIRDFSEGGVHAIKRIFVQKVSAGLWNFASHEEQLSPWRILVLF